MPSTASPSTSPLTPQPCTPLASSTAPSPPLHPQVRDGEYILAFQRLSLPLTPALSPPRTLPPTAPTGAGWGVHPRLPAPLRGALHLHRHLRRAAVGAAPLTPAPKEVQARACEPQRQRERNRGSGSSTSVPGTRSPPAPSHSRGRWQLCCWLAHGPRRASRLALWQLPGFLRHVGPSGPFVLLNPIFLPHALPPHPQPSAPFACPAPHTLPCRVRPFHSLPRQPLPRSFRGAGTGELCYCVSEGMVGQAFAALAMLRTHAEPHV